LPVARRFCVVAIKAAVFCRDRRFCRTPAERIIPEAMGLPFWIGSVVPLW
jgi:hypothetical protein